MQLSIPNKKCSHVKKGICRGCLRRGAYAKKIKMDIIKDKLELHEEANKHAIDFFNARTKRKWTDKEWVAWAENEIKEYKRFIKNLKHK